MDDTITVTLGPQRVERILNLTPHEIRVGDRVFPASPPAARAVAPNDPRPLPDRTEAMGVPVIEPYNHTEIEGLPREALKKPGCAVIVSQVTADWLRAQGPYMQNRYLGAGTSLYVPDTDKGAIREAGKIVGTTRLVFHFETF